MKSDFENLRKLTWNNQIIKKKKAEILYHPVV